MYPKEDVAFSKLGSTNFRPEASINYPRLVEEAPGSGTRDGRIRSGEIKAYILHLIQFNDVPIGNLADLLCSMEALARVLLKQQHKMDGI